MNYARQALPALLLTPLLASAVVVPAAAGRTAERTELAKRPWISRARGCADKQRD
jgi:hypothetical protein